MMFTDAEWQPAGKIRQTDRVPLVVATCCNSLRGTRSLVVRVVRRHLARSVEEAAAAEQNLLQYC